MLQVLLSLMARRAEEHSQLQLVEREDIDDEEDHFESIDKRTILDSFLSNFWIEFSFSVYSHVTETDSLKLIFICFRVDVWITAAFHFKFI